MRDHQEMLDLAASFALGILDAEEARAFEEHLGAGCAECEQRIRESAELVDQLVATVPPLEPSPELRARLFAGIREGEAAPQVGARAPRRARSFAAAAALAASIALALYLGNEVRVQRAATATAEATQASLERELANLRDARADLERQLAAAQRERALVDERLAGAERDVEELTAQATRTVTLAGTPAAPGAEARAYLDPENQRLTLVVYKLPPPPPGKSYQLWVILGDVPVSAGVFDVDAQGRARFQAVSVPRVEGPATIAVTIEPAGGAPQPSGPIVLAGS